MSESHALAQRALDQLPDLDAIVDELAEPTRVLARMARPRNAPVDAIEADAARILENGRRALLKLRGAHPQHVALAPGEQLGLEAVVLLFGRPALLVQNGTFAAPPAGWEVLEAERPRIEATLAGVGRIELLRRGMVGTGFLVAPDVVMTNRHVAEAFAVPDERGGWSFKAGCTPVIDYIDEHGATRSATFGLREVIAVHPDVRIDLALLRVGSDPLDDTPAGWRVPRPLPLAASAPRMRGTDRRVYVVGYPASDNQGITPPAALTRIFGDIYEVKRLQPGMVTSISATLPRFSHDCSTLGGNSGSCVVDLGSHEVIGLHFSGAYRETNYAVALWKLTRDPLLRDAGVTFV